MTGAGLFVVFRMDRQRQRLKKNIVVIHKLLQIIRHCDDIQPLDSLATLVKKVSVTIGGARPAIRVLGVSPNQAIAVSLATSDYAIQINNRDGHR